jgi:integrase
MRRTESPDRHLQKRDDGGYRYVRRVPARALLALRRHEPEYPETVRRSLDTHDIAAARAKRDAMEIADDDYWAQAVAGDRPALEAYERAIVRARSLKVEYRPAADLARDLTVDELLARVAMIAGPQDRVTADAVLGAAGVGTTSLDDAFTVFETKIRKKKLARKSPLQRQKWRQLKQRGISNFKAVSGDIAIEAITRSDAIKFYEWWLARVVPDDSKTKPLSASAGNKDLDSMRALYREYMGYMGHETAARLNPFAGLHFEDRSQNTRPAISEAWIRNKIIAPGALDGLNTEARLAVLASINTGARPSEIVNLPPSHIVLDGPIPYIDIKETANRELKVVETARRIPLAGVSLEAFRQASGGFPRYRDRDTLSALVNKFFRTNHLFETEGNSLYSFRHSFEARLKLAEVDEELRRYLLGHSIKRPKYGYSEDLQWSVAAIAKVAI